MALNCQQYLKNQLRLPVLPSGPLALLTSGFLRNKKKTYNFLKKISSRIVDPNRVR
jgi:hypothetical protein